MAKTKKKKTKELKQNSFLNGAFIATLGIVGSKILGMLYVIPFYAIIGDKVEPYMVMLTQFIIYFNL